jgi:hypothetical protein
VARAAGQHPGAEPEPGPLQRRLGLATLAIDTAGASMISAPRSSTFAARRPNGWRRRFRSGDPSCASGTCGARSRSEPFGPSRSKPFPPSTRRTGRKGLRQAQAERERAQAERRRARTGSRPNGGGLRLYRFGPSLCPLSPAGRGLG